MTNFSFLIIIYSFSIILFWLLLFLIKRTRKFAIIIMLALTALIIGSEVNYYIQTKIPNKRYSKQQNLHTLPLMCVSYFDGCNWGSGLLFFKGASTMKYCSEYSKPVCFKRFPQF